MAKIKNKTEFAGSGCLVQGIGLVLLFFFPIGTLVGIGLLLYGSRMAIKSVCSECGNRIDSKDVKLCPTCRATFE